MKPITSQQSNEAPQFVILYRPTAGNSKSDDSQDDSLPAPAKMAAAPARRFLAEVLSLMEANLNNPQFTIEELSRKMGMSYSSLNRNLQRHTGQRAVQLLREIRLQKAQALLRQSTLSVSEVAYETGFTSPTYFSRTFSRETGMPPSEYRNANRPVPERMKALIGCTEFSPG